MNKVGLKISLTSIIITIIFFTNVINYKLNSYNLLLNFSFVSLAVTIGLIISFYKKRFTFFWMIIFIYETFFMVILKRYVLKIPETSWRRYFTFEGVDRISASIISLALMLLILGLLMTFIKVKMRKKIKKRINKVSLNFYLLILITYSIVYLLEVGFSMRSYNVIKNGFPYYEVFKMNMFVLLMLFSLNNRKIKKMILFKISLFIYFILTIILFFTGYRSTLIEVILFLGTFYLLTRKKKVKIIQIIKLSIIGSLFFIMVNISKYILKYGIEFDKNKFSMIIGNHEANIFTTLNALIASKIYSVENTYLSSLTRILPSFITKTNNITVSNQITTHIWGENLGYNLGAFFIAEAYYNNSVSGVITYITLITILFVYLEYLILRDKEKIPIYVFICCQIPNIIFYGSSNYLKMILYTIFYWLICIKLLKISFKN